MPSSNSCYIGVDLGGTTIKYALIDNDGNVLQRSRTLTEADEGHDAVLERMIDPRAKPTTGSIGLPKLSRRWLS